MATKPKTVKESAPKAAPAPEKKKAAVAQPVTTTAKKPAASTKKPAAAAPAQNTSAPAAPVVSTPVKAAKKPAPAAQPASDKKAPAARPAPAKTASKAKAAAPVKAEAAPSPAAQVAPVTQAAAVNDADQASKWWEIRLLLDKLKEDTLREIRKSVKNGTEATATIEPGGDIYDQASSERDRELGLLLGDREREKIHSIDEALLRIDEGDYGVCEECDEDIPLGRLKAMPFTRHCVKCKSDLEKLMAQTKRVEEERAYREIPIGAEDDES